MPAEQLKGDVEILLHDMSQDEPDDHRCSGISKLFHSIPEKAEDKGQKDIVQ